MVSSRWCGTAACWCGTESSRILALPWAALAVLFDGRSLPPREGETLRCDFSRFQALRVHGKPVPENPGSGLNPHGVYDSHIPESFSVVHLE